MSDETSVPGSAANAPSYMDLVSHTGALAEALRFVAASASVMSSSNDMTLGYKAMAAKERLEFEGK